jgi:hypothetical protein
MLESIYRAPGLRVGLFTSPHPVSFRERIQVNRQLISEADVVRLVRELHEQSRAGVPPAQRAQQREHSADSVGAGNIRSGLAGQSFANPETRIRHPLLGGRGHR